MLANRLIIAIIFSLILSATYANITATPNPFTLSNTAIAIGQYSIANTIMSGGIGPYSGEPGEGITEELA